MRMIQVTGKHNGSPLCWCTTIRQEGKDTDQMRQKKSRAKRNSKRICTVGTTGNEK